MGLGWRQVFVRRNSPALLPVGLPPRVATSLCKTKLTTVAAFGTPASGGDKIKMADSKVMPQNPLVRRAAERTISERETREIPKQIREAIIGRLDQVLQQEK